MKTYLRARFTAPVKDRGYELSGPALTAKSRYQAPAIQNYGHHETLALWSSPPYFLHKHQHPSVLIGAGLLAKKALEKGLQVKPYVKTSLAPGSPRRH